MCQYNCHKRYFLIRIPGSYWEKLYSGSSVCADSSCFPGIQNSFLSNRDSQKWKLSQVFIWQLGHHSASQTGNEPKYVRANKWAGGLLIG